MTLYLLSGLTADSAGQQDFFVWWPSQSSSKEKQNWGLVREGSLCIAPLCTSSEKWSFHWPTSKWVINPSRQQLVERRAQWTLNAGFQFCSDHQNTWAITKTTGSPAIVPPSLGHSFFFFFFSWLSETSLMKY